MLNAHVSVGMSWCAYTSTSAHTREGTVGAENLCISSRNQSLHKRTKTQPTLCLLEDSNQETRYTKRLFLYICCRTMCSVTHYLSGKTFSVHSFGTNCYTSDLFCNNCNYLSLLFFHRL